jgi:diaminohydroxyphosphoribosylaminopyrimidine deaminase/5-amino-6-(5-phosphoribosylamino)uracil reductase
MNTDEKYMSRALELAERGRGRVSPNPMVGAVIVRKGRIVGRGYHAKAGLPHAEIVALKEAGRKAGGSTLYVNLEPCNHFGRTPPCTEAIIESGIEKVIVAGKDPNPLNYGQGISRLKSAGIEVTTGILEDKAKRLNEAFRKFITREEPFVTMKIAVSLDGKIATAGGESQWITGKEARQYVQQLRRETDAILVGINTVIKDDPRLTLRNEGQRKGYRRQPLRVVVDSRARIPLKAKVLEGPAGTIVATTRDADKAKIKSLEKKGIKVLIVGSKKGKVDLAKLMKELGKSDVVNLLIEGGGEINASALASRLVDKVIFFLAPRIIGGREAPPAVGGRGIKKLSQAITLPELTVKKVGDDLMLEGYLCY